MANHKSAKKRHRQSLKRRLRNRDIKSACRTAVKKTRLAIKDGDSEKAQTLYRLAQQTIASATAKGIYHKKTAARLVSRLAIAVNKAA